MPCLRKLSAVQKQKLDRQRKQTKKVEPVSVTDKDPDIITANGHVHVRDNDQGNVNPKVVREKLKQNVTTNPQIYHKTWSHKRSLDLRNKTCGANSTSVKKNVVTGGQPSCSDETVHRGSKQSQEFKCVDFNWQVDKCLEINAHYDAGLNISKNLPTSQPYQINQPGRCVKVRGDGNCFFRCLSYLVCGDQTYFNHMRQVLLLHMCSNSEVLGPVLPANTTMVQYIHQSRKTENNVWATEVEIMSMAHLLQTDIYTYSKYGTDLKWLKHPAHFVDNSVSVNDRSIYLDHQTGDHYDVHV